MYVHEVLVNRLGGLSLPRKSVVRLTDRPDMTLDVYRGRKTTMQQQQQAFCPTSQNINNFWYYLLELIVEAFITKNMRDNPFKQWKLTKLHEKIKHNEKGCHAENLATSF